MGRSVLEKELAKYEAVKPSLLGSAAGKYVLIHHDDVAGVFESFTDAVHEGYQRFGNVPFLVKQVAATEIPANIISGLLAC
jgi:hypothetical protein